MDEDAFPDVRWGHRPGPLFWKAIDAYAASRPGSWLTRKLTPLDHRLLSRINGRYTVLGPIGIPLLLLTTTGKKSGQRRQTPLTYLREGDRLFVVGSNFGQSIHPAWSWNLLANPEAWVTMGDRELPVVATQLVGAERDCVFTKFVEFTTVYKAYRDRADCQLLLPGLVLGSSSVTTMPLRAGLSARAT